MTRESLIERIERSPGTSFVELDEQGRPRIIQHDLAADLFECRRCARCRSKNGRRCPSR